MLPVRDRAGIARLLASHDSNRLRSKSAPASRQLRHRDPRYIRHASLDARPASASPAPDSPAPEYPYAVAAARNRSRPEPAPVSLRRRLDDRYSSKLNLPRAENQNRELLRPT